MGKARQYFTQMRFCKNCYYNMEQQAKAFKASKALRCPSCGSQDRTKFKRSK